MSKIEENSIFLFLIEEYKSIRFESLGAIKNQHSSLRIAVIIISAVFTYAYGFWKEEENVLIYVFFLICIPIISYLFLGIWLGELARMLRAGNYIKTIEEKVSKISPDWSFGFESWLRNEGKIYSLRINYYAVICFHYGIIIASILSGIIHAFKFSNWNWFTLPLIIINSMVFFLTLWFFYSFINPFISDEFK